MKAITVRQPWAQAIVEGHKNIENRGAGFPKKYRGDLLIHAGAGWSERGQTDPRIRNSWASKHTDRALASYQALLRHSTPTGGRPIPPFLGGVILGVVEVLDIHLEAGCCQPWGETQYVAMGGELKTGVTHLVLDNPRKFIPIEAKGALGLWTPTAETMALVDAALTPGCVTE